MVDKLLQTNIKTFGEEIIFNPKAGGTYKVRAVFDNDFQVIDANLEQVVSGNQPAIGLNLNDLPFNPKKNDEVIVRDITYKVQEIKEDGQGGVTCLLHSKKVIDANAQTRAN